MEGTYHTELENDGTNLVIMVNATNVLGLKIAIPWHRITEAVAPEVRARFVKDEIAIHFIGSRDGMRFSLRDLTEDWVDQFDPADDGSIQQRDVLLNVMRECISRIEDAASPT